jgi:hypothetical protein
MGKLSSAIVQRKLASLRDVEEALARQVLYGGDLATNLLEQAPGVSEEALTELLAETEGLASAPAGELPRAPLDAVRLVPGDIALRQGLYPLEHRDGVLVVAVSEPLKPEVEQDLGFALGVTLTQRIAPLVRIRQAISRDYGLPLDRRSLRVIAKLEGRPDPNPSVLPGPLSAAPDITSLPRPPSMPPIGLPKPMDMSPLYGPSPGPAAPVAHPAPPSVHEAETAEAPPVAPIREEQTAPWPVAAPAPAKEAAPPESPRPGAPVAAREAAAGATGPAPVPSAPEPERAEGSVPAPPASQPSPPSRSLSGQFTLGMLAPREKRAGRRRGRHRGPYTAATAEQDLFAADTRDEVLTAFFDFASQYFEYSALFAVHGDLAEGRDAYGPGADRAEVMGIGVPLDMPGALANARSEARFVLVALGKDGLDAELAKDLKRRPGKKVLLLPVLVRERCVLILYGDDGDEDVELSEIGDVIAFATLVATALENVILRKKTAVRQSLGVPAASLRPPVQRRAPLPSREERAEALAEALKSTVRPVTQSSPPAAPDATDSERPAPPRQAPPPPPKRTTSERRTTTNPAVPAARALGSLQPGPPPSSQDPARRSITPSHGTPVQASTPPPEGPGPVFALTRKAPASVAPEVPSEDGWDVQDARPASARKPPPLPDDHPDISIGVAEADVDWGEALRTGPEPQVVVAKQLPPKRYSSAELRLPKVILNIDDDLEGLVGRLLEGDESVIDRLKALGSRAASVLVSRFPGPTKPDSDRLDGSRLASQRGPVLRALARIGQAAVPFLAVRSNDEKPEIRAWATRLLGEIPTIDAAHAVARRVSDSNADVRRSALDAGKLLQADDESRTALRDRVCSMIEDTSLPIESRIAAVEALAHFRDPQSVPRLVRLVTKNDEVGQSVQWALGIIARQTFGRDAAAWEAWWQKNSGRHRIEWLIDALMHDDIEVRRGAGEELKALTKEYFGYYDDLSKGERQKAQKRYREWWEATGRARFSR